MLIKSVCHLWDNIICYCVLIVVETKTIGFIDTPYMNFLYFKYLHPTSLSDWCYVYTRANCYRFMGQVTKNRNYHG